MFKEIPDRSERADQGSTWRGVVQMEGTAREKDRGGIVCGVFKEQPGSQLDQERECGQRGRKREQGSYQNFTLNKS